MKLGSQSEQHEPVADDDAGEPDEQQADGGAGRIEAKEGISGEAGPQTCREPPPQAPRGRHDEAGDAQAALRRARHDDALEDVPEDEADAKEAG